MDIALTLGTGPDGMPRADWSMAGGDLAADTGLRSRVAVSLLTDAVAAADDELPDASGDRRGWWGDITAGDDDAPPIGSRLWLLARQKRTETVRLRAESYAVDALAWATARGVADSVAASAEFAGERQDQLRLTVTLSRGAEPDERFDALWSLR